VDPQLYRISRYSNAEHWVIAQNAGSNTLYPGKWSRIDWAPTSTLDIWYCHTAMSEDAEQKAFHISAADSTDPASGGCKGEAWALLSYL
jgi:hypothetical protein